MLVLFCMNLVKLGNFLTPRETELHPFVDGGSKIISICAFFTYKLCQNLKWFGLKTKIECGMIF